MMAISTMTACTTHIKVQEFIVIIGFCCFSIITIP